MKPIFFSFLFLLFSASIELRAQDNLEAFNNWKKKYGVRNEAVGVALVDLSSRENVFSFRSESLMTPASTQKLISTYLALESFPSNHRFKTYIYQKASIEDSVLLGDLLILGGGDMSLGSRYFKDDFMSNWTDSLKKRGIKKIDGNIIANRGRFDEQMIPKTWSEDDIGNYYGAGSHGLSYFDNLYELHFKTGSVGSEASLKSIVPTPYEIEFTGKVRVEGINYDNCYIYGGPYENSRKMTGSLPPNRNDFLVKASQANPERQLAFDLMEYFKGHGIEVAEGAKVDTVIGKHASFTLMFEYEGQALSDVVYWTNMKSVNLFAEQLLMHTIEASGTSFSYKNAKRVQSEILRNKAFKTKGLALNDGSGLSRENLLSCDMLCSVLTKAYTQDYFPEYKKSLPLAGKSGSLKSMLLGSEAQGKIWAKSGSFKGVRAYAGYMTKEKKDLAFAVIMNDNSKSGSQMKKALEELILILYQN